MSLIDPLDPTPDFNESYNHLMRMLEHVHEGTEKDRTFEGLRSFVSDRLSKGFTANQLGQAYAYGLEESRTICQLLEASVGYAEEAEDAYNLGKTDIAWPRMTFAYYFLGMATITEVAVRGALARPDPDEHFKKHIVELLEKKHLPEPWPSRTAAVDAILEDFLDYYNRLPQDQKDMLPDPEGSLKTWSSNSLSDDFEKYAIKTGRGRPPGSRNVKQSKKNKR